MTRFLRHASTARTAALQVALVALLAGGASAQTRFERHKNSYSPEDDVKLGREAAEEVRKQMPLLNDERTEAFVEKIGERLIESIPAEWKQPAFQYSFDVVNLREINAFALPGGPMFLNRGMIQASRSEGEIAGVMAHELSHVILRHGTAQATSGQKFQIGAIAGQVLGSIIGGTKGAILAQGTNIGLSSWFLKYSREYEREADLFGAQLMAYAGYDPRAMSSMFETIEKQGGNRAPEWMSDHPNPGNRVQAINREAQMLQVRGNAASNGDLQAIHARLNQMPQAPTSEQVARAQQGGRTERTSSSRTMRVEPPSGQWRTYQPGNFMRLSVPSNWEPSDAGGTVRYAPEGGVISDGQRSAFTHGIEIGVTRGDGRNLQQQTESLLQSFARANPQLRRQGGYSRAAIGGRQGLTTTLSNVSDLTGETEAVNVSTVQLQDGSVLFMIGVAPASEARTYLDTFGKVRQSIQLADGDR